MNRAVFLDRDGTIHQDTHYLHSREQFVLLPGALEGMRLLQELGYMLIIVTNQSGIARGYYSEADYSALTDWMTGELRRQGVHIDAVYYCPHLPDAPLEKYRRICECRKPAPGLFLRAALEHSLDLKQCWMIGDRLRDCPVSEKLPCRGILVGKTESEETIDSVRANRCPGIRWEPDLSAAAAYIASQPVQAERE